GAVCSGAAAIERVPVCGLAVKRSLMHHPPSLKDLFVTSRGFLTRCGMGMGAMSLAALFGETGLVPSARAAANVNPLSPKAPPFPGKAKRVVHFFLNGGPSHVDSFDPKPS